MRNMKLVGVSVLMAAGMGQGAWAAGAKPEWCGEDPPMLATGDITSGDPADVLTEIIYLKCNPDQVTAEVAAKLDTATKKMQARYGLTDADWGDVAEWAALSPSDRTTIPPATTSKAWSQLDPIEQFAMVGHPSVDAPRYRGQIDLTYATDALGAGISESGRLAYVAHCLNDVKPVEMAMCQPDLDALDGKKLSAELRTPGHRGVERMVIRYVYDQAKPEIAARRAAVAKLIASDPAYKQMFDIAKQQRTEWDARWKENGEPLKLATAMDDAVVTASRKATSGCQDKTWHALSGAISKVPAKAFVVPRQKDDDDVTYGNRLWYAAIDALLSEPDSYLASAALATCFLVEAPEDPDKSPNFAVPHGLIAAINYWSGMRGPRTSTATRILQAGIQFDNRDAKIEVPEFHHYWEGGSPTMHGSFVGTITAVKPPKGDQVNLVFKTKDVTEYTSTGCHSTGQIRGIMSNGEFDYVTVCTGAKASIVKDGPPPQDVTKNFGAVVKPGNVVVISWDTVMAVWKDAKATAPSFVLGQPVK